MSWKCCVVTHILRQTHHSYHFFCVFCHYIFLFSISAIFLIFFSDFFPGEKEEFSYLPRESELLRIAVGTIKKIEIKFDIN